MSMLLKALESVEQDRKKQDDKAKKGQAKPDVASSDVGSGSAPPPDAMSLDFEPGGGLEIKVKEEKPFDHSALETLEFDSVESAPVESKKPAQEESGGLLSALAFDMDDEVSQAPTQSAAAPAEKNGGGLLSALAFDMDDEVSQSPTPTQSTATPVQENGGSLISGLAFDMDDEVSQAPAPTQRAATPVQKNGGSLISGLAFDMDDEVSQSPTPTQSATAPAQENGGSLISGLAFDMDDEVSQAPAPTQSVAAPAQENGGSLISGLAFDMEEVVEESPEIAPTPTSGGGSMISGMAFDMEEVVEESPEMAPTPTSGGGSMISGMAFDREEVVEESPEIAPTPTSGGGSMISGMAFDMEEVVEESPESVASPASGGGSSMISGMAFDMEEVVEESSPELTPQDMDDDEDDVTMPIPAAADTPPTTVATAPVASVAVAEVVEDGAEDGWDAAGDMDKTEFFSPVFLGAQPKEVQPKKRFGDANQSDSSDGSSKNAETDAPSAPTFGSQDKSGSYENLQQKAKSIFDASGRSTTDWKKWGLIAAGVLAVSGGSLAAYQTFFSTPTVNYAKKPAKTKMSMASLMAQNSQVAAKEETLVKKVEEDMAKVASNFEEDLQPSAPMSAVPVDAPAFPDVSNLISAGSGEGDKPFVEQYVEPNHAEKPEVLAQEDITHNLLVEAQHSYYNGQAEDSSTLFHKVLMQDRNNRDALMGLAALSVQKGEHEQASGFYLQMLQDNPSDSIALAGLVGIRAGVDPHKRTSQIKTLLLKEPDAHHLHFALGSLNAVQKNWGKAQQSFFSAYSLDKKNPDYAFNLAVSMDHLGHTSVAKNYYQTALSLLTMRPGNFDESIIQNRLQVFARNALVVAQANQSSSSARGGM